MDDPERILQYPYQAYIPTWDRSSYFYQIMMNEIRVPYFMALLCDALEVYNLGTFLEFFTQSPTEIVDKFPLNTFLRHTYPIAKCCLLAKFIAESDYSPLPIGVRTHPTLFPTLPDTAITWGSFNFVQYHADYVRKEILWGSRLLTLLLISGLL